MNRREILSNALLRLSREFDVECPELLIPKSWMRGRGTAGYYIVGTITLNWFFIKYNFALALKTLRHEFAHYLQDLGNIDKRCEVQARRFEKNSLALGILPKSQTRLIPEAEEVSRN